MMGKCKRMALLVCLCVLFLAGCGEVKVPDVVNSPAVAVDKEGGITVWQIGDFDKAYYDVSELTTMAVEEVKDYNAASGKEAAVSVEKVETLQDDSGKVAVVYRFDGWESCADFGENKIFYGTVGEAVEKGFGEDVIMKNLKDNTILTEDELAAAADRYLIITDIRADIYCPRKVTHISDGAVENADGSISSAGTEGLVYILLK